jgi:hypothetical protein
MRIEINEAFKAISLEAESAAETLQLDFLKKDMIEKNVAFREWDDNHGRRGVTVRTKDDAS